MVTATETASNTRASEELKYHVNEVAKEMADDEFYGQVFREKIQDAMDFVLTGAVDLEGGKVHSGAHHYDIDAQYGCTCPDATIRNRYCKHYVAFEMQRRVNVRMEGGNMPAKPKKTTPQDEWEASVQSGGETSEEPKLFAENEPEPDDVPDPEVPPGVREATELAMASQLPPDPETASYVRTEGYQYTDYPATFCIKRMVGKTEVMCTFRATDDDAAWDRMARMLNKLEAADKRQQPQGPPPVPQGQAVAQQGAAPQAPPPPPQATYATTAAGQVPMCPVHNRAMKPSQYGGFYCTGRNQDGSYCKTKA